MGNAAPSAGGQAPEGGQPQAGNPGNAPQAGGSQQPPSTSQFKSLEEADAAFSRLLKDKQDANNEAAETKRRLKQLEDAQKTEEQKRAERLAELEASSSTFEQERQSWRVKEAVLLAAPEAGLNPALALKLIDLADVKSNAKGEPTNIPELLAKAVSDFGLKASSQPSGQPTQRPASPNIGASNPPRSASSGNEDISWDYIGRLLSTGDRATYDARHAEIQAFMRKNPQQRR